MKSKTIVCVINDDLAIRLENCIEVYGHDDCLPFNADVFVYDKEDETESFHKIAIAYNDGWGGDSVIEPTMQKYLGQLKKIDDYLKSNFEIVTKIESSGKEIKWDLDLEYLISSMACYCIDGGVTQLNISQLDGYHKKIK